MGRPFIIYPNFTGPYYCNNCHGDMRVPITAAEYLDNINVISEYGDIFMFKDAINLIESDDNIKSSLICTEGTESIRFIYNDTQYDSDAFVNTLYCVNCNDRLGWSYYSDDRYVLLLLRDAII